MQKQTYMRVSVPWLVDHVCMLRSYAYAHRNEFEQQKNGYLSKSIVFGAHTNMYA